MSSGRVGVVANPVAGTDVRRIVTPGAQRSRQEKVRLLACLLVGLREAGVEEVLYLAEPAGLVPAALEVAREADGHGRTTRPGWTVRPLELPPRLTGPEATARSAAAMAAAQVGCIVVLGGDGTARLVALAAPSTPMLPLPGGTNNAFAFPIEPTAAGLAAGRVASGRHNPRALRRAMALEVRGAGPPALALVDVALLRGEGLGARAIWDLDALAVLVACRAEPGITGLSALAATLCPLDRWAPEAVWLRFGTGGRPTRAAIAPGLFARAAVTDQGRIGPGDALALEAGGTTLALDGERDRTLPLSTSVEVSLVPGPLVVDPLAALSRL